MTITEKDINFLISIVQNLAVTTRDVIYSQQSESLSQENYDMLYNFHNDCDRALDGLTFSSYIAFYPMQTDLIDEYHFLIGCTQSFIAYLGLDK